MTSGPVSSPGPGTDRQKVPDLHGPRFTIESHRERGKGLSFLNTISGHLYPCAGKNTVNRDCLPHTAKTSFPGSFAKGSENGEATKLRAGHASHPLGTSRAPTTQESDDRLDSMKMKNLGLARHPINLVKRCLPDEGIGTLVAQRACSSSLSIITNIYKGLSKNKKTTPRCKYKTQHKHERECRTDVTRETQRRHFYTRRGPAPRPQVTWERPVRAGTRHSLGDDKRTEDVRTV